MKDKDILTTCACCNGVILKPNKSASIFDNEMREQLIRNGWYLGITENREEFDLCPVCLCRVVNSWYKNNKEPF